MAEAQAQLDALNAANLERYPDTKLVLTGVGFHSVAVRLQDDLVRDVRPTLHLLWGGAACVLLIGCVNIASLVFVRSRGRLQEVATRLALGAGARRIIGQFVIENTVVTMLAGIIGLLIGHAALQLFGASVLDRMPWATGIGVDAATVGYTMVACAFIGVALGVVPALGGLPLSLSPLLREAGRTGTLGHHAHTTRRLLVVTEMALAFVLLVGAGLLVSSFQRVLAIDPGFDPEGVLTASVNLPPARYAGSDGYGDLLMTPSPRCVRFPASLTSGPPPRFRLLRISIRTCCCLKGIADRWSLRHSSRPSRRPISRRCGSG